LMQLDIPFIEQWTYRLGHRIWLEGNREREIGNRET
jgi:hypothetical protein